MEDSKRLRSGGGGATTNPPPRDISGCCEVEADGVAAMGEDAADEQLELLLLLLPVLPIDEERAMSGGGGGGAARGLPRPRCWITTDLFTVGFTLAEDAVPPAGLPMEADAAATTGEFELCRDRPAVGAAAAAAVAVGCFLLDLLLSPAMPAAFSLTWRSQTGSTTSGLGDALEGQREEKCL